MSKLLKIPQRNQRPKVASASTILPQKREALFPRFVLISLGLGAVNTLGLLFLSVSLMRLTFRPPAIVQQTDGTSYQAEQQSPDYRSNKAIVSFVELELKSLFTWTPVVASSGGAFEPDEGVKRGDVLLPTGLAAAELGLSLDANFRQGTIDSIAESFKKIERQVFSGEITQHIDIVDITDPQPLDKPSEWKVNVIANQILTTKGGKAEYIPFNRTVFVRSEYRDRLPPAQTRFDELRNEIRGYGLTVIAMREIERPDYTEEPTQEASPDE
jgi:hypothetical protein